MQNLALNFKSDIDYSKVGISDAVDPANLVNLGDNVYISILRILGNLNNDDQLTRLKSEGLEVATPEMFFKLLKLLKLSRAECLNGRKINKEESEDILREILDTTYEWRGEYFGIRISEDASGLGYSNGSEITGLQGILMDNKDISLRQIIGGATIHGFPFNSIKDGSLRYTYPRNKAIPRFQSSKDGCEFLCCHSGTLKDSRLGIRPVFYKR